MTIESFSEVGKHPGVRVECVDCGEDSPKLIFDGFGYDRNQHMRAESAANFHDYLWNFLHAIRLVVISRPN